MIIGGGIDVCDVERFAESVRRTPALVRRLFTPAEAERPVASLAARFAAKEAFAKALGAPAGLSWQDAEVVTDEHGTRDPVQGVVVGGLDPGDEVVEAGRPGHAQRRRHTVNSKLTPERRQPRVDV